MTKKTKKTKKKKKKGPGKWRVVKVEETVRTEFFFNYIKLTEPANGLFYY